MLRRVAHSLTWAAMPKQFRNEPNVQLICMRSAQARAGEPETTPDEIMEMVKEQCAPPQR